MSAEAWANYIGLWFLILSSVMMIATQLGPEKVFASAVTSFLSLCWPGWATYTTLRHLSSLSAPRDLWSASGWFQLYWMAEAVYLGFYCARLRYLQRPMRPPAQMSLEERRVLMDRALAACPEDRGSWLSGWFQGAPCGRGLHQAQIWRGNAEEWLAWCLFGKAREALSPSDITELSVLLMQAEQKWGLGPFPGENASNPRHNMIIVYL